MSRRTLQEMTAKDGLAQQIETGPDQNSIEAMAYEHWLARGCPEGSPEVDWLRAGGLARQRGIRIESSLTVIAGRRRTTRSGAGPTSLLKVEPQ